MKEVTSELNITLIVLISVGILATFFFNFVWPMIRENFEQNASCSSATCNCNSDPTKGEVKLKEIDGVYYCTCIGESGAEFDCVYKG